MGSTSSGRARSDPTHHHHHHPHHHHHQHGSAHAHSSHPHPHPPPGTMECESPSSSLSGHAQRILPPHGSSAHGGSRSQGAWGEGALHSGQQFSAHRGHHHLHQSGHLSGPLAPVQSSTTSLSSTSSSSSSALPGPQNLGTPGHSYPPPAHATHPHAQRPVVAQKGGGGASATAEHHHHHGLSAGEALQGIEPQLGSLSMQLGGYGGQAGSSSTGGAYGGQWPSYPFTITQANPVAPPQTLMVGQEGGGPSASAGGHARSAADSRGEESPMVGVCVQQSPVASH